MKNILYLITILLISLSLHSCDTTEACDFPNVGSLTIYTADSTTDSFAVITRYKKETNFTQPIDSSAYLAITFDSGHYGMYGHVQDYNFNKTDDSGQLCDFIISVMPSGKTYKLTKLSFGGETYIQHFGATKHTECTQSETYEINGLQGSAGGTVYSTSIVIN